MLSRVEKPLRKPARDLFNTEENVLLKHEFNVIHLCTSGSILDHLFLKIVTIIPVFQFRSGARVAQRVRSLDLTAHTSLSPIRRGFAPSVVNYKKGYTRLAAASDKVYQLLV